MGQKTVTGQKSQDLAGAPLEALQEPAPEQPANIAQPEQPSLTEGTTATAASAPPGSQPTSQSGAPANPAQDALPDAARAVMLIASDNPQRPGVSLGSTVWSTISPAPGHPATVAVKADADIPTLKMHATLILRKNTDPALQAAYTMDLKFSFADGAPITGVKNVEPKMRNLGPTELEALTSVNVKTGDSNFLIVLVNGTQDTARRSRPDADAKLVRLSDAARRQSYRKIAVSEIPERTGDVGESLRSLEMTSYSEMSRTPKIFADCREATKKARPDQYPQKSARSRWRARYLSAPPVRPPRASNCSEKRRSKAPSQGVFCVSGV